MDEYDEFAATLYDAGFAEHEIEMLWQTSERQREAILDAVHADGERDLCASIEDYQ